MIKHTYIPLHVAEQATGELLELYVQPKLISPGDIFSGLSGAGLGPGINKARHLLQQLNRKAGNGIMYCTNSQPPIINPESVALGLLLMSQIIKPNCAYQTLIVSADIEDAPELHLKHTGYWQQKLAAILKLGWQEYEVPLILSADTPIHDDEIQQLKSCNITTHQLSTVGNIFDLIVTK